MRRLSLCAIFLALTGSMVTAVVVRTWANDPPPAAKPKAAGKATDDPFGDNGPAAAARAKPAAPKEESPPPGLRPYPRPDSSPSAPSSTGRVNAVAGWGPAPPPPSYDRYDRILTAEMAAAPEPQTPIDIRSAAESAAFAKINAALASPTKIDCTDAPLEKVVEELKERHKIEIQLDRIGLKDAGVNSDYPVTKRVSGISLRAALHLLLDELQLKYVIRNEVLLLTSNQKFDESMVTRLYPVKDLVLIRNEHNEIQPEFQPLIELVEGVVDPKTWTENGGNGSIAPHQFRDSCLIVVTQTLEVHEKIVDLLAAVRRCCPSDAKGTLDSRLPKLPRSGPRSNVSVPAPQPPVSVPALGGTAASVLAPSQSSAAAAQPAAPPVAYVPLSYDGLILTPEMATSRQPQTVIDARGTPSESETKIEAALASPTELACDNAPLQAVVDLLKKRHKIEIQLDYAALKDMGIEPDAPVTKHLSGISLRSALNLLLDDLQLKYVMHNEVLLITSPVKAESDEFLATKFYLVKDLILVRSADAEIITDFKPLIDLIENTICATSWSINGGNGTICEFQFQDHCLLVVSQSQEAHEQIAHLLAALRSCSPPDAKNGKELRLPKRPKPGAPEYYVVPGSAPRVQGGGMF